MNNKRCGTEQTTHGVGLPELREVKSAKAVRISRAVAVALALSSIQGVYAADGPEQTGTEQSGGIQEVQVTGTRIMRVGMTTPTPVTQLSTDDLQLLSPTTIGEAITKLPQFIGSAVPEGAPASGWTGASGATILNLRGIGANRTLVLLDGRRVVSSTRTGTLDVNLIPQALLKSVDVVTGGASAAYGSDAVGGVVNFVLDTKYQGLSMEVQGGESQLSDNRNYSLELVGGTQIGDKLHVVASADFYHVQAIRDAFSRDWEQSWGVISNPLFGQPGQPQRVTAPNARSTQYTEGGLITSGPLAFTQFLPGGATAPFVKGADFTTSSQSGGSGVDPLMYNYLTPQDSRGNAFAHLTYDITDHAHVFIQGLYGINNTNYLSPPAGGAVRDVDRHDL